MELPVVVELPFTCRAEVVKEVKLGVAETAMVLVPLRAMLLPALKKEIGELYRLLHWVVEAESGIT
jgi:hypothetical protein